MFITSSGIAGFAALHSDATAFVLAVMATTVYAALGSVCWVASLA